MLLASGTTMSLHLHSLIKSFEPLLVGRLTGKAVPCALSHREPVPAWTLAVPSLPVCEAHLEGQP
jgi:hypothetical protein